MPDPKLRNTVASMGTETAKSHLRRLCMGLLQDKMAKLFHMLGFDSIQALRVQDHPQESSSYPLAPERPLSGTSKIIRKGSTWTLWEELES